MSTKFCTHLLFNQHPACFLLFLLYIPLWSLRDFNPSTNLEWTIVKHSLRKKTKFPFVIFCDILWSGFRAALTQRLCPSAALIKVTSADQTKQNISCAQYFPNSSFWIGERNSVADCLWSFLDCIPPFFRQSFSSANLKLPKFNKLLSRLLLLLLLANNHFPKTDNHRPFLALTQLYW